MTSFTDTQSCFEEADFVKAIQTQNIGNSLFYGFDSYHGRLAAEFSLIFSNATNVLIGDTSKISIFHMNHREKSLGLISANLLHKICGPYPEIESDVVDPFKLVVRTFLLPMLTVLVLTTNAWVCIVFSRRHMLNPVFLILLAIGLMELANSLLPLPFYLAQSWFQRRVWWESLPRHDFTAQEHLLQRSYWTLGPASIYQTSSNALASQTSAWTTVFLPTITHTCSVWLTITLALQRLVYVSRPQDTSRICTLNRSIFISLIILFGSFMIHLPLLNSRFVEFRPIQLRTRNNKPLSPSSNLNRTCLSQLFPELPVIVMKCHYLEPKYMLTYFYARIVLIHLMPCGILVILTSLLVFKMRQITQLRKRLNVNSSKRPTELSPPDSDKPTHEFLLDKSSKCLEICCKPLMPSSPTYVNGSVAEIRTDSHRTQNQKLQLQVVSVKERKRNSMGSPQAISRMLIVVLIKFIAMHLPNAIALLVYVLITLQKRDSPPADTSHSAKHLNQSTIINLPSPSTPHPNTSSVNPTNITQASQTNHWARLSTMCNLIILVSYQLNFVIYYTMSTAFRETFKQICRVRFSFQSCLGITTKHSASHPTSPPNDTNQSNPTMNQTESGENERHVVRHPQIRQIIPVLVESQID